MTSREMTNKIVKCLKKASVYITLFCPVKHYSFHCIYERAVLELFVAFIKSRNL